jgi:WD40 repeat protein
VACIDVDGQARLLDIRAKTLTTLTLPGKAITIWVAGSRVLTRTDSGLVQLDDSSTRTSTSKRVGLLPIIAERGVAVAWIVGSGIRVWNTESNAESNIEAQSEARFWLVADGRVLVWRDREGQTHVHVVALSSSSTIRGIPIAARPLASSPSGRYLITSDTIEQSAVWDAWSGSKLFNVPAIDRSPEASGHATDLVRFLAPDQFVAVNGEKLFIADVRRGTYEYVVRAKRRIIGIDVSKDGEILSASEDGSTTIFDPRSRSARILPGEEWVFDAQFSPDGKLVADRDSTNVIRIRPDDLPKPAEELQAELLRRSTVEISAGGQVTGRSLLGAR